GFAELSQKGISLTVGQTLSLNLAVGISGVKQEVVVAGTPPIDVARTEASTTLDNLAVSNTPVLGRKFEDLLTLTPGVSVSQGPDGDEINFNGQRGIFNNISLDGGDYNNGFFGEQLGGQRAAIDITLDAIGEFQVVASGANAEFGRTAGGVINVVTKSGTNDVHGSLFEYQRLEALTANTSDGKPLDGFHREQFGGTIGGPIRKDKVFFFGAFEQIISNLQRANLSQQLGPAACPVSAPTVTANEALINANFDCQRLALLNFFQNRFSDNEGLAVQHPIRNSALLGKLDWNMNPANRLSISYNFDYSKNENQTFDVPTYGSSANGTEGPSKIQAINANQFTTLSNNKLNEAHFSYSRETRPRAATKSPIPADAAVGFKTTFRFGNPFFLQPGVDETFWRAQFRDNFSVVQGKHTWKAGAEWIHTRNSQVFRGFFTGRYIFDTVDGFLHFASPASMGPGFGPTTAACSDGTFVNFGTACPGGSTATGGPLLFYLQGAGRTGLATDATGFSDVANEDFALFAQDKWQIASNITVNYGLRWEAQKLPDPTIPPSQTVYAPFLNNPAFPSNGKLPSQWKEFQPRLGFSWDVRKNAKSVFRANAGIYNAHQNLLSQVGSITTNGVQQQSIFTNTALASAGFTPTPPAFPGVLTPPPLAPGVFPPGTGIRVFDRNYRNPRVYTWNAQYEQAIVGDVTAYADFTWSKGVFLTNFLDYNRADRGSPFAPILGETQVTSSRANSLYRGLTVGVRKRLSHRLQVEGNYVYSKDYDNDSNERDPFTDRSFDPGFNLRKDYSLSDRDETHKFNAFSTMDLPAKFRVNLRLQAHSAQPITTNPDGNGTGAPCSVQNSVTRVVAGIDCGRNHLRKDNAFSSFDWRLARPFKFNERYSLTPTLEMFNTFNSANNVNPLITPGLFNFDGFLRQGVGDPRQLQFSAKFEF
ncbi:MAG TPA: hypothetical protein VNW97_13960, partial [Candidatus Saccharimonadales bacterium]|nr:hypothetical protein [Candidatus Saccharimonadales bacterium]